MCLKSWLERAFLHASSKQCAKHHAQNIQGHICCSFPIIPFCLDTFTGAPSVPPPIKSGLPSRTLALSRIFVIPNSFGALPRYSISSLESAFFCSCKEKNQARVPISSVSFMEQRITSSSSTFPLVIYQKAIKTGSQKRLEELLTLSLSYVMAKHLGRVLYLVRSTPYLSSSSQRVGYFVKAKHSLPIT